MHAAEVREGVYEGDVEARGELHEAGTVRCTAGWVYGRRRPSHEQHVTSMGRKTAMTHGQSCHGSPASSDTAKVQVIS